MGRARRNSPGKCRGRKTKRESKWRVPPGYLDATTTRRVYFQGFMLRHMLRTAGFSRVEKVSPFTLASTDARREFATPHGVVQAHA